MTVSTLSRLPFYALAALVIAGLGLSPAVAQASQATGSLGVTATVVAVCVVATTPIAFGTYQGSAGSANNAQGTVVVTCSNGTPYTVALGAGNGTGATEATHYMSSGSNLLNYLLYTNSGHTTLWGDGTLSTSTQTGTAGVLPTTYTVYGSIPVGQYVPAGAYLDSVTVTVTY